MKKFFGIYASSGDVQTAIDGGSLNKPYVAYMTGSDSLDYNTKYHEPKTDYLTFDIISGGTIVWSKTNSYSIDERTIYYSKDFGTSWSSITSTIEGVEINVNAGDVVKFKGDNNSYARPGYGVSYHSVFSLSTAIFRIFGNIMSLISSTNFANINTLDSDAFPFLFDNCTGLTDASGLVLPATNLSGAKFCYYAMFRGCTSLTTAPELPATTLGVQCYMSMFNNCQKLTTAPELPATTLANSCYNLMFRGCTNLNYIKCLATDISASNCTQYWVNGVQTTAGTFVKDANMSSWTTGTNGIPNNWTVIEE